MVLLPDLALARRLEFHEAWSCNEHARMQARLFPKTGAVSQPLAEGHMVYCGKKSPLSQVIGWGLSGPVLATDLDRIEAFYRSRGVPPRIRVCPLADPTLLQLLGKRRYIVQEQMNAYARSLDPLEDESSSYPNPNVSIRIATSDEAERWLQQIDAGGDWAEPDGVAFMLIRCTLKSETLFFLAWRNGRPVSGGALELHNGMAALMAAETETAFRNQGIHTALLRKRLVAAVDAGCDLAMVHTRPGAVSQHHVLRAGFQLVYTVHTMVPST